MVKRVARFGTATLRVRLRAALLIGLMLLGAGLAATPGGADGDTTRPAPQVWVMTLDDAIGPAVAHWFIRSLARANQAGAALFVLRLDTPGGLDRSMREMIHTILASRVPVATYVAPAGSRAASAGTYILYASHIAAMAPATNLGAATPVQIGGDAAPTNTRPPSPAGNGNKADKGSTLHRKQVNDAVAYIRGLAELRGRNPDWAEQAVRQAVSLTASQAVKKHVVDLMAADLPTLLNRLDGRTLSVAGQPRTLHLSHYQQHLVVRDWRTDFLAIITNPSIAYILLLAGVYGLILEFVHPGTGVPGVVGAISLLLGLYALQMLPVSYVGLGLLVLGIGLIVAEALSPAFGVLGLGGVTSFLVGSVMLMDTDIPAFRIALPMIAALGVGSLLLVGVLVRLAVKAQSGKQVTGDAQLIGETAVALTDFNGFGQARLHGEVWRVRASGAVRHGERLVVRGRNGLTLDVEVES